MRFVVSVDLGQKQDYSALSITERKQEIIDPVNNPDTGVWKTEAERKTRISTWYEVRYLHRWPLNTPYDDIAGRVSDIVHNPKLDSDVHLVVDGTGVGAGVVELFRQHDLVPVEIVIHGGKNVTRTGNRWNVPKMDLIAALSTLFERRLINIAPSPFRDQFVDELATFRYKLRAGGGASAEAWRQRDHDDLVLSVAQGVWYHTYMGEQAGISHKDEDKQAEAVTFDPFEGL